MYTLCRFKEMSFSCHFSSLNTAAKRLEDMIYLPCMNNLITSKNKEKSEVPELIKKIEI